MVMLAAERRTDAEVGLPETVARCYRLVGGEDHVSLDSAHGVQNTRVTGARP